MAYTTGTASSIDDLIDQLIDFAVASAGFDDLGNVISSSGSGSVVLHTIHKGGVYWTFGAYNTSTVDRGIAARMSYSAPAAGINWTSTALAGWQSIFTRITTYSFLGPFVGHYFFTEGTCVHAVVEVASGIYAHMSLGSITKYGAWDGGEYLTGSWLSARETVSGTTQYRQAIGSVFQSPVFSAFSHQSVSTAGSYIRLANTGAAADFQIVAPEATQSPTMFVGPSYNGQADFGYGVYQRLLRDMPNAATQRAPLLPGVVLAGAGSGLRRLVGMIPYVAYTVMPADMNAKDITNTDWQVFPVSQRTGGDPTRAAVSFGNALAYRRVA